MGRNRHTNWPYPSAPSTYRGRPSRTIWQRLKAVVKSRTFKIVAYIFLTYVTIELATIPYDEIASLDTHNPKHTALMRQRLAEAEADGKRLTIRQKWVPLSHVPKDVRLAIIVSEDGMFYAHGGVDWYEVQESIERNIEEGRAARGASTITQQVAKNLYLSTAKTPMRKFKELIITYLMEEQLRKRRILEIYVNIIEWGRGIFGIEAAAQRYFHKSARELTRDEAARLAAVIPRPLHVNPNQNSQYVLKKKQLILRRMALRRAR